MRRKTRDIIAEVFRNLAIFVFLVLVAKAVFPHPGLLRFSLFLFIIALVVFGTAKVMLE